MHNSEQIVFGECHFSIQGKPVSLQSSGEAKRKYQEKIKQAIHEYEFIFYREVSITITWYTDVRSRYLTDSSNDIDNIIKPIIDAIVGKDGLLIDDCQVQHVECYWLDVPHGEEEYVEVCVQSLGGTNDYTIDKQHVCFFQKYGPIYYMVPIVNKISAKIFYEQCCYIFSEAEKINKSYAEKEDGEWAAEYFQMNAMPMAAVSYHITRLNRSGFPCIKKEEIEKFIDDLDIDCNE